MRFSFSSYFVENKRRTTTEYNQLNFVPLLLVASSALAFCTYILATNPSEQQKLQQEIDSITLEGNHPIYDELQNKFFYLDLFVQEVLRIFPIGNIACTRRCILSTKIGDITIEQGSIELESLK